METSNRTQRLRGSDGQEHGWMVPCLGCCSGFSFIDAHTDTILDAYIYVAGLKDERKTNKK